LSRRRQQIRALPRNPIPKLQPSSYRQRIRRVLCHHRTLRHEHVPPNFATCDGDLRTHLYHGPQSDQVSRRKHQRLSGCPALRSSKPTPCIRTSTAESSSSRLLHQLHQHPSLATISDRHGCTLRIAEKST